MLVVSVGLLLCFELVFNSVDFWFFDSVVLLVTVWLVFMVRFLFVVCLVVLLMVGWGYGFVYG